MLPTRPLFKKITSTRIRKWEAETNQNFHEVSLKLLRTALGFFGEHRDHFSREAEYCKRDPIDFFRRLHLAMTGSLKSYIDHEIGYTEAEKRRKRENWRRSADIFRQVDALLAQIPKENRDFISRELARASLPQIGPKMRSSIMRMRRLSVVERINLDTRGNKKSRVSVLARALFEHLEWEMERDFKRSFNISPPTKEIKQFPERSQTQEFDHLDSKLVFELVKVVVPSAAIGTVQSALKAQPSRKSLN